MKPTWLTVFSLFILGMIALMTQVVDYFVALDTLDKLWVERCWLGLCLLIAAGIVLDFFCNTSKKKFSIHRNLPSHFSLAQTAHVQVSVENHSRRSVTFLFADTMSQHLQPSSLPVSIRVSKNEKTDIEYALFPVLRGDAAFHAVILQVKSWLGFWTQRKVFDLPKSIRIYPSLHSLHELAQLGIEKHLGQLGVHLQQRRGHGLEFHQLREFRQGDSLRQIDWRASSSHRKPIAREYEDEKNQDVIFLLDCGRRMRSKDGVQSHFDHSLEAMLQMSYVALKQGDSVGMLSFAGESRWLAPVKGTQSIQLLLNQVYDLQTQTTTSDFSEAAQELIQHHKKRALIVLLTKVREEDQEDLIKSIKLLSQTHLVLIASLQENFVQTTLKTPVTHFEDALVYSSTIDLLNKEKQLALHLSSYRVYFLNTTKEALYMDLVQQYLEFKRSGLL